MLLTTEYYLALFHSQICYIARIFEKKKRHTENGLLNEYSENYSYHLNTAAHYKLWSPPEDPHRSFRVPRGKGLYRFVFLSELHHHNAHHIQTTSSSGKDGHPHLLNTRGRIFERSKAVVSQKCVLNNHRFLTESFI